MGRIKSKDHRGKSFSFRSMLMTESEVSHRTVIGHGGHCWGRILEHLLRPGKTVGNKYD